MIDFELTDVQKNLREILRWFAKEKLRPVGLQADKTHEIPMEFFKEVMSMGIAGGSIPREMGGEGEGVAEEKTPKGEAQFGRIAVMAAEELAYGDAAVLISLPGPGLGAPPVRSMGTPEQQKRFFSIFQDKSEPKWGAFALTEPGAGSDVAGISATVRKEGDYYIINGTKSFITNGAKASWVVVFATVDKKLGRGGHRAFVVEKGTPGFRVGKIEEKMGLRAAETAELVFEDCKVPAENLLGGEEYYKAKEGFKGAMGTFDATRPAVGAMAVGIGRAAYEYVRDFIRENLELGRPLASYRAIKEELARMERELDTARALCWKAAWMLDLKKPNSKEASMAKAYSAQIAMRVCSKALELMGPFGVINDNPVEKWFRDIKVFDIFEGTGQIQRVVISKRLLGFRTTGD